MIFCVEDDNAISDLMIYTLNASGFEARGFSDGQAMFAALKTEKPELIMLDIMLPGEDGISILKRLRSGAATADIPVIMSTAKDTEYDKVTGLDLGADDYPAKPFGMMEMVSRVRAVLRRAGRAEKARALSVGDLTLDAAAHTVTANGAEVRLTLKEFELLRLLMETPGIVFTRARLLRSVRGEDFFGETRTVDVHIGTLRTKPGGCGDYIETVRGVGYRMGRGYDRSDIPLGFLHGARRVFRVGSTVYAGAVRLFFGSPEKSAAYSDKPCRAGSFQRGNGFPRGS